MIVSTKILPALAGRDLAKSCVVHRIKLLSCSPVKVARWRTWLRRVILVFMKLAVPSQLTFENGTLRLSVIAVPPAAVVGSDGVRVIVALGNPDWLSTVLTRFWASVAVLPGKARHTATLTRGGRDDLHRHSQACEL